MCKDTERGIEVVETVAQEIDSDAVFYYCMGWALGSGSSSQLSFHSSDSPSLDSSSLLNDASKLSPCGSNSAEGWNHSNLSLRAKIQVNISLELIKLRFDDTVAWLDSFGRRMVAWCDASVNDPGKLVWTCDGAWQSIRLLGGKGGYSLLEKER